MNKVTQLEYIFEELKYHNLELIYKYGLNNFYIKNKKGKPVSLLRSFHDLTFDKESKYYSSSEQKVMKIKSDYNYVLNMRSDC